MRNASQGRELPPMDFDPAPVEPVEREPMPFEIRELQRQAEADRLAQSAGEKTA